MRMRGAFAVFFLIVAHTISADPLPPVEKLKIGIVAFNGPKQLNEGKAWDAASQLKLFFENVSAASRNPREPGTTPYPRYDFELYAGNYYQILSWLKSGDLDGAVVSPFTAYLLARDRHLGYEPILEVGKSDRINPLIPGRSPVMFLTKGSGSPLQAYNNYVATVWKAAQSDEISPELTRTLSSYQLNFVNHLSTSGFVAPLLYAHKLKMRKLPEFKGSPEELHQLEDRFWRIFFRSVRLKLTHTESGEPDRKYVLTVIEFSYRGDRSFEYGQRITPGFLTPNDVLVVRPSSFRDGVPESYETRGRIIEGLVGKISDAGNPWRVAATRSLPRGWLGAVARDATPVNYEGRSIEYAAAGPANAGISRDFGMQITEMFKHDGALEELEHKWYVDEAYDFHADEITKLLLHDQQLREVHRTALVLPGGGVRGAYQARLLDDLFDDGLMVNAAQRPATGTKSTVPAPLVVDNVIGTSGGALVGFFAAQRKVGATRAISRLWMDGKIVKATARSVFPLASLPRWFTAWLIVLIFAIILLLYSSWASPPALVPRPETDPALQNPPRSFRFGLVVLMLAIPSVTALVSTLRYIPSFEAVAYGVSTLVAHFLFTCCGASAGPRDATALRISKWVMTLGVVIVTAAGIWSNIHAESLVVRSLATCVEEGGWITFAVIAGFTVFLIGFALAAHAMNIGLSLPRAVAYLKGLAVLSVVVVIAALVVLIGYLFQIATSIELTGAYWVWTFLGAGLAAVAVFGVAEMRPGRLQGFVRDGVDYWRVSQTGRAMRSPIWALEAFAIAALLIWTVTVSPGLYSGCQADTTFRNMQVEFNRLQNAPTARKGDRDVRFLSDLLVTTTSLGRTIKASKPFHGDYYCCVDNPECSKARNHSSRVLRFSPEGFPRAVFASGSPFPIFPALLLQPRHELKDGTLDATAHDDGYFIDGGYAHNVPLEGAQVVGADQVLLIRNARRERQNPDEASTDYQKLNVLSPLAWNAAQIVPFLFERSQQTDSAVAGRMFVASLAPDTEHGPPAFLMDFRDGTVSDLVRFADEDYFHRRIGQVESWGVPHLWTSITQSAIPPVKPPTSPSLRARDERRRDVAIFP